MTNKGKNLELKESFLWGCHLGLVLCLVISTVSFTLINPIVSFLFGLAGIIGAFKL